MPRSRSRRTVASSRSSPIARGTTRSLDDEQRRVAGAGPVAAGEKLTPNPAADVQPVFSRTAARVFVRAQRRPGFESDRWYLDAYDRATGAKRTVFETPDLSVGDFTLSPTVARSGLRPPRTAATISSRAVGRRRAEARRRGRRDLCAAGRPRLRRVLQVDPDGAGRAVARAADGSGTRRRADARERVAG